MLTPSPTVLLVFLALSMPTFLNGQENPRPEKASWPSFHGENAAGVAHGYPTPTRFNVEKGENIGWKTPLPGLSHSSPIVWGDRIFLTNAVKKGKAVLKVGLYGNVTSVPDEGPHEFQVLCIDRLSGKVLWTKTAWKGVPEFKRHPKGSHAASTPATDGTHVVAFFGSEGLYAYDYSGKLIWKKNLGSLDAGWFRSKKDQWGFASSPIIHEGRVYVQCDVQDEDNSFVAALDVKTGEEVWRTQRLDVPTWSTPTVHVTDKRRQLILNGFKHIGGYDLDSGKELWKLGGGGDIPVPTPIVAHDLVFITNAHGRMSPIVAISTAAEGTLSMKADDDEHVAWSIRRGGSYMQTPLVYGDYLYACRGNGSLSCFDAKTGKLHYRERLGGGGFAFTASGVAADGKLYYPSEEGEVFVIKAGTKFENLALNELGETCMASPAISRGVLYFRTRHHLIAARKGEKKK